ncbi:unnamed protein product [Meloidogyne enterolobii]|uniref:Uncharacterized protein n=2 Tax=Meloidogyne enterolobii TaxID=390850 RepID=A0ACB0Z3P7_MELEN
MAEKNNSSSEVKNSEFTPSSNESNYDTLFASRYTNNDDEYKRASITISHEPICLSSLGLQQSNESGRLYSRINQERNYGDRNWRHTPYWRRGRGNMEENWNNRRDYRRQ